MSRNSNISRFYHAITYTHVMIGILCLSFIIRIMGLNKGIWMDEYLSLRVISAENFFQILPLQNKPPLFYLFHKLWSQISMSEPFLRLLSVVFGIGTVIVMMRWIKRYSRLAALVAGILCATLPIMLRYSQEIRGYSILLFATVCSFFFASNLAEGSKKIREYIGLSCSLSVAVSTHLIGIMLIPSILIFIALALRENSLKIELRKSILAMAFPCIIVLYFHYFFFQQLPVKSDWWMPSLSFQLIISSFKEVLGFSYLTWPLQVLRHHAPSLMAPYKYSITLLIIGVLVSTLFFGNWRRGGPLFVAAVIYWLQVSLFSLFIMPIFWYRTVLPGLIPFIGFIGVQIATIETKKIKSVAISGIVIVTILFVTRWVGVSAWVPYERWKQLSEVLELQWKPEDLVIFYPSPAEGPVRYYFPDLPTQATIAVKKGANIEELDLEYQGEMDSLTKRQPRDRIFLIVRFSASVQKDIETYNALLKRLESRFGQPFSSQKFGILSLSKYELRS